jgi:hypothetical protein
MSTTIPRRLVYRALAAVLHNQARTVAGRTAKRSGDRRGERAEKHAAEKAPKRLSQTGDLRVQADELSRRIGDPRHYQGPGLDPAMLGWLSVLALGYTQARTEIERIAGPGAMAGVDWLDMPMVLDRILTLDH